MSAITITKKPATEGMHDKRKRCWALNTVLLSVKHSYARKSTLKIWQRNTSQHHCNVTSTHTC